MPATSLSWADWCNVIAMQRGQGFPNTVDRANPLEVHGPFQMHTSRVLNEVAHHYSPKPWLSLKASLTVVSAKNGYRPPRARHFLGLAPRAHQDLDHLVRTGLLRAGHALMVLNRRASILPEAPHQSMRDVLGQHPYKVRNFAKRISFR